MLIDANSPRIFWNEVVAAAVYLSNLTSKREINSKTPEEVWSGKKPDISDSRIFVYKAVAYIPRTQPDKIAPSSKDYQFLKYFLNRKAYRLWYSINRKVIASV